MIRTYHARICLVFMLLLFVLTGSVIAQDEDPGIDIEDTYTYAGVTIGYLPDITGKPAGEMLEASIDRMTEWPAGGVIRFPEYSRERLSGLGGRVMVFPVADFRALDPIYAERIDVLGALLRGEIPLMLNMDVPRLPAYPVDNPLVTHLHYLDFANGTGLRYVTMSVQNTVPPTRELDYAFLALTADGETLIYATFPVDAGWLPTFSEANERGYFDAMAGLFSADTTQMFAAYDAYMLGAATVFDNAPAESFTPSLDALDAMLATLSVE